MTDKPNPKLVIKLVHDKTTPGTHRYKELPDNPNDPIYIATVYLKNLGVVALGNPGSLVITIEAGD